MERVIDHMVESPLILRDAIQSFPKGLVLTRPAAGGFAIVEHAWHLADFEEEGIAVRIRRTLTETNPLLADFRGDAIASERRYIDRQIEPALERFAVARTSNAERLRNASASDWSRVAVQEHVGDVTLGSLAHAILQHDVAHANEIVQLMNELRVSVPAALARLADAEPLARSA